MILTHKFHETSWTVGMEAHFFKKKLYMLRIMPQFLTSSSETDGFYVFLRPPRNKHAVQKKKGEVS